MIEIFQDFLFSLKIAWLKFIHRFHSYNCNLSFHFISTLQYIYSYSWGWSFEFFPINAIKKLHRLDIIVYLSKYTYIKVHFGYT